MTTSEGIARLKGNGYGVRVQHHRRLQGPNGYPESLVSVPMARKYFPGYAVDPRGGMTVVTIYDRKPVHGSTQAEDGSYIVYGSTYWAPSDDILAEGFAFCSNRDNFSRKRGLQIAFGRAVKTMSRVA